MGQARTLQRMIVLTPVILASTLLTFVGSLYRHLGKQAPVFRGFFIVRPCQGDRQARPYNTKLPIFHVNVYCMGEPGGRPGKAAL